MLTLSFSLGPEDRVIYSARLHSRIVDSIGAVRPSVRCGGWKGREAFPKTKGQVVAPDRLASTDHPVFLGRLLRDEEMVFSATCWKRGVDTGG